MQVRLALFLSALVAVFSLSAASALASGLPGDRAIDSSSPFRLNEYTLEPGCFIPGRGPVDLDSHLNLTYLSSGQIARELHVTVDDDSPVNVDQVLVPSAFDGYKVYNKFENTGRADDIGPNYTAVNMFAPDSNNYDGPDPIAQHDVIVCVSDHGAAQNEPYQQEAGGLVSAKNRPIVAPKVTALGVSAVGPLHTFKIGFGYDVEKWYSAPSFDGAGAFPTVTDPNAEGGGALPAFVRMDPRPGDFGYDARRVNDVDAFGDSWKGGSQQADYGQNRLFSAGGDSTGWTLSGDNQSDTLGHLITFTAQGDLPISWTLRPSLASPSSQRTATFTDDQFRAWWASWQAYYAGKGPKPSLPLAPGTNSPAPDPNITVVNSIEVRPGTAPQAPVTSTSTTIITQGGPVGARSTTGSSAKKASKTSIRSARVVATKQGKRLVVFVKSTKKTARIKIRMYDAKGRMVGQVTKTVRTNRSVKVSRVAGKVKTVKVSLA
ncbi:MAG TPA: hypothetical protein VH834_18350 [Solirubrobacteraceae bacterium]|jgi:hypothetical protein